MSRKRKVDIEPKNDLQIAYKNNILQPLKGFCTVVESDCSFVESSRKLGLTPATLTKQVQALEKELKMNLFDRTSPKCLKLTEIGLKFYNMGADVLSKMDNLIYTFKEKVNREEENILKVGTNPFMLGKLIPIIAEFKALNKKIRLEISSYKQDEGLELVRKNKLDIFITSIETNEELDGKMEFLELFDYVPYWMLWKGHPLENKKELTKNDLLKCTMVYDEVNTTMKSLRAFYHDNKIESIINLNNMVLEVQKELIRYKIGIWVIFNVFCSKKDVEEFVFKKATNLFPSGKYGMAVNKFRKNSVDNFMDFITGHKKEIFDGDLFNKIQ